jgi:hypothetical protein
MEINVDDVMKMRFPLPVVVVPPQNQAPSAPPPSAPAQS